MNKNEEIKDLKTLLERLYNFHSETIDLLDNMKSVSEAMGNTLLALQDVIDICEDSPASEPEEIKTYTFADVRKAFSAKAHAGFTEQIKSLINSYGAGKLSAIKETDYPQLMKDLEAIK